MTFTEMEARPQFNFDQRVYARWSPSAQEQDGYGRDAKLARLNSRAHEFIRMVNK